MTKLYWVRYNALETYGFYDQTLFHIQSLQVLGFHIYYVYKHKMIFCIYLSNYTRYISLLRKFMISSHVYNNPNWVMDVEYQHYDDKNHKVGILSHISSQVLSLPIKWDKFKSQPTISYIEEVQQVVTKYAWRSCEK